MHLQKPLPHNGDIHRVVGGFDVAFGEGFLSADNAYAATELQPGRHNVVLIEHRARRFLGLVKQILKHHPVALKACGVNVGDVVGNRAHFSILRREAGFADP